MQNNKTDRKFMIQALEAASTGRGRTGTNPLVGACLVKEGQLLGVAAHEEFGAAHAEARLLEEHKGSAAGADLYCTLEPCVHTGKRPPCLPLVVESGVSRVILAHTDPDPRVAGRGMRGLLEAGIEVVHPVLREEYRRLNRRYFYNRGCGLPWVEVKLALSADGYIASSTHDSQWLNSRPSREEVHRQRSRADGVMVGGNTVRQDDPELTVRHVETEVQPTAIVVSAHPETIPSDTYLLNDRAKETIMVIPASTSEDWRREISGRGVRLLKFELYGNRFNFREVLEGLAGENIGCIYVEGGGGLAGSLVEADLVNELHLFYCGKILGGGIKSFNMSSQIEKVNRAPEASPVEHRRLNGDIYVRRLFRRPLVEAGLIDVYQEMTGGVN